MDNLFQGKFITFEGVDGAGKTDQVLKLSDALLKNGIKTKILREPGGTVFGEKVRSIILETREIDPLTEILLFFAARNELMEKEILPRLKNGEYVICDRFYDSTIVYQGVFKNYDIEKIMLIKNLTIGNFEPDLTFILDIPPKVAIERISKRKKTSDKCAVEDKFDTINENYYEKIIEGYKKISEVFSFRTQLINACKPVEVVAKNIKNIMEKNFSINLTE